MWTITYLINGKVTKFQAVTDCKYEAIERFNKFVKELNSLMVTIEPVDFRMISCLEDSRTTTFKPGA